MSSTECTTCGGIGWIPSKGYRFYSQNGKLCPCGVFRKEITAPGSMFFDELRQWVAAIEQAKVDAERKAARAARRAARSSVKIS
jgi:hypothetical protein